MPDSKERTVTVRARDDHFHCLVPSCGAFESAVAAVLARPLGGILSDRVGAPGRRALPGRRGAAGGGDRHPPQELAVGSAFVAMAFALGLGTGGLFAWVARQAPAERVGAVTGIVGGAGGLGGCFPPLLVGTTCNEAEHTYTVGLSLLCVTAVLALLFTLP